MLVTLHHYLIFSVILFVIGIVGIAVRRNTFIIVVSPLLMFDAACISFLAFARWSLLIEGKVVVFFILGLKTIWFLFGLVLARVK